MKKKKQMINTEKLDPLFDKLGALTTVQRVLISLFLFFFLIGPFVYFSFFPKYKEIKKLETDLSDLRSQLSDLKKKADLLPGLQRKMKNLRGQFNIAKKALPESEEIPTLLTNISSAGQDSGLEFLLFRPKPDRPRGFYADIPIEIRVRGSYHNVAKFFDKLSTLPRIVNILNINIANRNDKNDVVTNCTAVTYKFLEEKPTKGKKKKKGGKAKPVKKSGGH